MPGRSSVLLVRLCADVYFPLLSTMSRPVRLLVPSNCPLVRLSSCLPPLPICSFLSSSMCPAVRLVWFFCPAMRLVWFICPAMRLVLSGSAVLPCVLSGSSVLPCVLSGSSVPPCVLSCLVLLSCHASCLVHLSCHASCLSWFICSANCPPLRLVLSGSSVLP